MIVCIAEDRQSELTGVKLLIASLSKHCQGMPIELIYPPADDALQAWLGQFPHVNLRLEPVRGATGWNVKPSVLLSMLDAGYSDVVWMDSDTIVNADFRKLLLGISPETIVVTEECSYGMYRDEGYRALAWGFEIGRLLPHTLNSCVVRVTPATRGLLETWQRLLASPIYREAQNTPADRRPFHLYGDQDVLTALLSSRQFEHLPLKILLRGKHIIQDFGPAGYSLGERLQTLLRPPFILHCQRDKPWKRSSRPPSAARMSEYVNFLRLEASPYLVAAGAFREVVDDPMPWRAPRSMMGRVLRSLGLGHIALTGLPLALLYSVVRLCKAARGVNDRFDPGVAFARLQKQSG